MGWRLLRFARNDREIRTWRTNFTLGVAASSALWQPWRRSLQGAADHAGQHRPVRSSRRRSHRRFHPVRGRPVLHRGARLARRRGGEDREPEDGRSRQAAAARAAGQRSVLLPRVQREQEVDHAQPEIAARSGPGEGHAAPRRCLRGELRARHDRAARSRLRRRPRPQPADHLRAGEGLRRRQPVRAQPRLRHDRAGLRRHVQRDRRARRPADAPRHLAGRHRHRHADGDHHPGRAAQARRDRPGQPAAGGDAGRDPALHADQLRDPGR